MGKMEIQKRANEVITFLSGKNNAADTVSILASALFFACLWVIEKSEASCGEGKLYKKSIINMLEDILHDIKEMNVGHEGEEV